MRSADGRQSTLFAVVAAEDRIPRSHPLRSVRAAAAAVLAEMRPRLERCYAAGAATATAAAPEEILRALLLRALYGIASERRLLEELAYNLLYRWFVGLQLDDRTFASPTFRRHRLRLERAGLVRDFAARTLARLPPRLLRSPHFAPDRQQIEAWIGQQRWDA